MKHRKIRWGLLGGGSDSLIGIVHRAAAYMGDSYVLIGGVFNQNHTLALSFAEHLELDPGRTYRNINALIEGESTLAPEDRMEVLTVATPNFLHFVMAKELIEAGFNVICEKPITTTAAEALELARLIEAHRVVFAVAHTYTGYPMVRQMRAMIAAGLIGTVQKVHAQYYQGWINPVIRDPEKRQSVWRLNPAKGGQSCCIGDIGVHAFNLIEYTTGLIVSELLADIDTLDPSNTLDVDGTVLLRFAGGIKGVLCASQIATAEENNLQIAVYGRTGALKWSQENPNRLHHLQEGKPLAIFTPGHAFNEPAAREASKLPPGHPEGFIDAMGNIYRGVAKAVRGQAHDAQDFPRIQEGVRGMQFVEAVLASAREGNRWTSIHDR
jgi:predicted dehydrogenase